MAAIDSLDFGEAPGGRERRGVSLRQIANATKIGMSALEALERNDISRLPGGIFSRAFVRSYAVEVGRRTDDSGVHRAVPAAR
jgi:cytoskeletal protein RodZ